MHTLFIIIICLTRIAAQSVAPVLQNANFVVLSDMANIIVLNGLFLQNVTRVVTNTNIECLPLPTQNSMSVYHRVTSEPCRILKNRTDACMALQALYGAYLFPGTLCESGETCLKDGDTLVPPCEPLPQSICSEVRCVSRVEGPTPGCYSFNDIALTDYACGPTNYCKNASICAEARTSECPSTLTCSLPPLTTGNYTLTLTWRAANGSQAANTSANATLTVLQQPYMAALATAANSAANTSAVPLVVSPGTAIAITWWPPNIESTFASAAFALATNSSSFAGAVVFAAYPLLQFALAFGGALAVYPVPVLYDLCPALAIAYVNSTIVIQGDGFVASPYLICLLHNTANAALFVNSKVVHCLIEPAVNISQNMDMTVSNDAVGYPSVPLSVYVIGTCQTVKPFSTPRGSGCVCTAGYHEIDGSVCVPCPDGSYQPRENQQACIPCDSTQNTNGTVANTASSACQCRDGRYKARASDTYCSLCPANLECANNRVGVARGYWRYAGTDNYGLQCAPPSDSRCVGGFGAGNQLCAEGYAGPLCNVCARDYANFNGLCKHCQRSPVNITIIVFVVASILLVVLAISQVTSLDEDSANPAAAVVGAASLSHTVIKIAVNYLQMLYYIGQAAAGWSGGSQNFFAAFIPVTISTNFFAFRCALPLDFYTHITLTMLVPVFVTLLLAAVYMVIALLLSAKNARNRFDKLVVVQYVSTTLVVLYMVHPTIALELLRTFRCEHVPGTQTAFMTTDMSVNCNTQKHASYIAVAGLYLVVYILGGCALLCKKIHDSKEAINYVVSGVSKSPDDMARIYLYFVQGYKPDRLMWEGVVTVRKLLIVGCSALLSTGLNLVWISIILISSITLDVRIAPYHYDNSARYYMNCNTLEVLALMSLYLTVVINFHGYLLHESAGTAKAVFALVVLLNCVTFLVLIVAPVKIFAQKLQRCNPASVRSVFARQSSKPQEIKMYRKKGSVENDAKKYNFETDINFE